MKSVKKFSKRCEISFVTKGQLKDDGDTDGRFARILRDLGFASARPVVRNIRAPLDIIHPVPAKRPHWRPLRLSKEKVSGNVSLLNLLQFTRDLAQHTRPVVPVLCDENIHYRICKMMYGEKTTGWNFRLFLRSHPIDAFPWGAWLRDAAVDTRK